jgi:hypothetical protein
MLLIVSLPLLRYVPALKRMKDESTGEAEEMATSARGNDG